MMTNVVMIVTLLFMLYLTYITSNKDYMTAGFLMIGVFIVSSIASLLYMNTWEMRVSSFCAMIITTMVVTFCVGDYIGRARRVAFKHVRKAEGDFVKESLNVSVWKTVCVIIFMTLTDITYFRYIIRIAEMAGNQSGLSLAFTYARYAITNIEYDSSMPTSLGHALIINRCLAFIYLFIGVYNLLSKNKRHRLINIIPLLLYIVQCGLSTARIDFMRFVLAAGVYVIILRIQMNKMNRRITFRTILLFFCGILLIFSGFRLLGYITRKSVVRNIWDDIFLYTGGSIPAFSYYLENMPAENPFFGKETLVNLYSVLRNYGLSNVPRYLSTLPFCSAGNHFKTNVYTAFRRLIQDYGFLWSYFIIFFEGLFYGVWTTRVKTNKSVGVELIIYSYMLYPVLLASIDEQFVLHFTAVKTFYHLFYFIILYWMLIKYKLQIPNN